MTARHKDSPAAFIMVGCAAAATHLSIVYFLVRGAGMPPVLANAPAFLCAFCVSHAGHSRFSFASPMRNTRSRWRWLQVSAAGFLLNQALTLLALRAFPQVWYLLIIGIVTGIVALIGYLFGKTWAFA